VTAGAIRSCALILAVFLAGAANRGVAVGYADLPRLLAVHPLHKVLDAYDREIAALRGTRTVAGLAHPSADARDAAAALRRDAAEAQHQVWRIAAGAARDRALEARAISAIRDSRYGAQDAMESYGSALSRETAANLRAYGSAIAQQTSRALAARQQELREKELELAYDLARRDAGARLMLRVKLADLHLDGALRARLEAQVATLTSRESAAVAALRAQDAAVLGRYRAQLSRRASAAQAQMAAQLRSKADANLALRLRAFRAAASAQLLPDLSARLETFGSSFRPGSDATAIAAGLSTAATELPRSFARLGDTDRESQAGTSAQIGTLLRNRAELYREMVAQIERDASRLGAQRGLRVVTSGARPKGSVDLTGAVARTESGF
jgi:hypothetical protein